jgi:hypothetical protein
VLYDVSPPVITTSMQPIVRCFIRWNLLDGTVRTWQDAGDVRIFHCLRAVFLSTAVVLAQAPGNPGQKAGPEEMAKRREAYKKANPPRPSIGLIPLTDLGTGQYKGQEGGLYAGGKNVPPAEHLKAGEKIAATIVPLDVQGNQSATGKIVLLAIGFSNPSIEFPAFQKRVAGDTDVNLLLVTVNGCVGSQAAHMISDPHANYWKTVGERLSAANVTPAQVEAVWLKEVNPGANPWETAVTNLHDDEVKILHILHNGFPNLKTTYVTSRSYGGYTELGGSPEPAAYETGFAVKALVNDQISRSAELNYDPAKGPVVAPWIEWGPYIWTDGEKGRKDGFVYLREDLREDGLHPSEKGAAKISAMMLKFFKTDPATRAWFLK